VCSITDVCAVMEMWPFTTVTVTACYITCLQNNASKLLLAIMESRHDSENAERILFNIQFKQLVCF